jgi:phage FluMu protein Com
MSEDLRCHRCSTMLGTFGESGRVVIERGRMRLASGWFSWLAVKCYACGAVRSVPSIRSAEAMSVPGTWRARRLIARGSCEIRCPRCRVLLGVARLALGFTMERQRLRVQAGWSSRLEIGCYRCAGEELIELASDYTVTVGVRG